MDNSSFGIMAHNSLRTVLVAHMSKHMKFKWLTEVKGKWKMLIISEKRLQ